MDIRRSAAVAAEVETGTVLPQESDAITSVTTDDDREAREAIERKLAELNHSVNKRRRTVRGKQLDKDLAKALRRTDSIGTVDSAGEVSRWSSRVDGINTYQSVKLLVQKAPKAALAVGRGGLRKKAQIAQEGGTDRDDNHYDDVDEDLAHLRDNDLQGPSPAPSYVEIDTGRHPSTDTLDEHDDSPTTASYADVAESFLHESEEGDVAAIGYPKKGVQSGTPAQASTSSGSGVRLDENVSSTSSTATTAQAEAPPPAERPTVARRISNFVERDFVAKPLKRTASWLPSPSEEKNQTLLMIPKRTDTLQSMIFGPSTSLKRAGPKQGDSKTVKESSRSYTDARRRLGHKGRNKANGDSRGNTLDGGDQLLSAVQAAGMIGQDIKGSFETDAIWENQRGFFLLGARYGRDALLPGDAPPWTKYPTGERSPYSIDNHPLPTEAWQWYHPRWLVDMTGDVDSEGYSYSTRFSSKYWRGVPSVIFFVRRRLWIRSRYRPDLAANKVTQLAREASQIEVSSPSSTTAAQKASPTRPTAYKNRSLASTPELVKQAYAIQVRDIDAWNPYHSWYRLYKNKTPSDSDERAFKDHIVHANFIRCAKVLVRKMTVDRQRVLLWQWWLGTCEESDLATLDEDPDDADSEAAARSGGDSPSSGIGLDKPRNRERPDIRDVWDLLERRLDDILVLFEYQDSRRTLLTMISEFHNKTHAAHHYKNKSNEPDGPSSLDPNYRHVVTGDLSTDVNTDKHAGGPPEMVGGDVKGKGKGRAAVDPQDEVAVDRLQFWSDVERRLKDLEIAKKADPNQARGQDQTGTQQKGKGTKRRSRSSRHLI